MAIHDVGELVVAVHQAGDEVEWAVVAQPLGRSVKAVDFAALDPFEERGPAVDLAFVEPVRTAKILQSLGLPVDLRQQRDALSQLIRQPGTGRHVAVKRVRPLAVLVHRRPAVDEPHQIEGPAQNRSIRADADGCGMRHVGAVESLDDPPLPQDALVPVGRGSCGGHAKDAHVLAAADLVDDVLRAAGEEARLERLTLASQTRAVHPIGEPRGVDLFFGHRLPTSFSR